MFEDAVIALKGEGQWSPPSEEEIRKHICANTKGITGGSAFRNKIVHGNSYFDEFLERIEKDKFMLDITLLYVFLIALAGSFLQANIGFGFPVIAMIFLPMILPFQTAVLVCQIIAFISVLILTIKYFSHIEWKLLLPLLTVSMIVTGLITVTSFSFDSSVLTIILAIMLVFVSVYFFIFSNKIKVKPTVLNGAIMGGISGIGNGLFSIGGPAVVLYLLQSVKKKESYLATIQFYFLITNLIGITIRLSKGALNTGHLPLILVGWIAMGTGTLLGIKSFQLIPLILLKKIVYLFVGISGIWLILSSIFLQ